MPNQHYYTPKKGYISDPLEGEFYPTFGIDLLHIQGIDPTFGIDPAKFRWYISHFASHRGYDEVVHVSNALRNVRMRTILRRSGSTHTECVRNTARIRSFSWWFDRGINHSARNILAMAGGILRSITYYRVMNRLGWDASLATDFSTDRVDNLPQVLFHISWQLYW